MKERSKLNWLAMIAWALACAAAAFGFASQAGLIAAFFGGLAGSIASDFTTNWNQRKPKPFGLVALCLLSAILPFLALLVPLFLSLFSLSALVDVLADEACDLGAKALVFTFIVRLWSRRFSWFRAIEASLIGVALAQLIAAHRLGNINRPYWIMDRWLETGNDPQLLLWLVGAVIMILMAAMLLNRSMKRSSVLLAMSVTVLLLLATRLLPPLPYMPPLPPPPPRLKSPDPPPPPPPDPKPIALVQLKTFYKPTERLGGYYFREKVMSRLEGSSFSEEVGTNIYPETWVSFPTNVVLSNNGNVPTNGREVLSEVSLLIDTNRPFVLVNGLSVALLPNPNAPFRRAYRCVSTGLGNSQSPDLDLSTFRQNLLSTNWTPAQSNLYLTPPSDSNLQILACQITKELPEELGDYLPPRVKVIRAWINQNLTFSSKAGTKADELPLTNFVFVSKIGGPKQFAMTAALLFRCAGVPSRLASGYFIASGKGDVPSQFVITDSHAQLWPEVYVENTGWVPVSLNPTNVIDRPNPPPDPEIEKMLEKKVEEKKPDKSLSSPHFNCLLPVLGIVAAILSLWVMVGLYYRYIAILVADSSERHKKALASALSLARAAGFSRQFGETYFQFAERVIRDDISPDKIFSKSFMTLVKMYLEVCETRDWRLYSAKHWLICLFVISRSAFPTYSCRSWRPFCQLNDRV